MNIVLMRNNSLTNVVNKNLTTVTTHNNAKFLDPYDEYAPVIRVKGKTNWDDVNYCKIESNGTGNDIFTRYYFVEGVTIKSPQISILRCRLDVLQTYRTFIGTLQCYLTRSESHGDEYLMDNKPRRIYNNVIKQTFKDIQGNVVGFVPPGQDTTTQKMLGTYVITTIQDDYWKYSEDPDPDPDPTQPDNGGEVDG